jgi:very-short-patch-repair endonuclease
LGHHFTDFVSSAKRRWRDARRAGAEEIDRRRTLRLNADDVRVLRVWNDEVFGNRESVLAMIANEVRSAALPLPPPEMGGGKHSAPQ